MCARTNAEVDVVLFHIRSRNRAFPNRTASGHGIYIERSAFETELVKVFRRTSQKRVNDTLANPVNEYYQIIPVVIHW